MSGEPELADAVIRWRRDPVHFARRVLGVSTLWERQVDILHALRDHRRVAVPSCHESGKALALDTPLPTPTGWTTMAAVAVGDSLFDEEGRAVRVTATSPVHERPCYRIQFSDGSEIVASDDHRWAAIDLCHRPRRVQDWRDHWGAAELVTTEEMADESTESGQLRWRVPACRALQTDAPWQLRADPYTFGAWLGNGTTLRAELTCHVDDAPHYAQATRGVVLPEQKDTVKRVRFDPRPTLHSPVREIGGRKCVPPQVLRGSIKDRLAVLRGLMDTDGYLGGRGRVEITLCDPVLADGAEELVRSLGWVSTRKLSPAKLYGRVVGTRHRIGFRPDRSPFILPRKAVAWFVEDAACGGQRSRRTQRTVVSVVEIGVHRVKCVAVDSPRHLYLAGCGMIPTHNTHVASVAAVHHLLSYQPSKVITTAPTQRQVKDLLWSEIRSRYSGMVRTLGGDPGLGSPTLTDWQIEPDWFATGFATSPDKASENASRLHGYHSPHLLVILDEAGGIAREVWSAIDGLLTSGNAKVLAIGNPAAGSEFERVCRSPDWRVLRISAFDCPNLRGDGPQQPWGVTRQWVDEMRRRWGEGSSVFQTKVLGLFPESSVDTLLSIAEVEQALARMPGGEFPKDIVVSIGVDVARFGSDETVIYVVRGNAVLATESWAGQDTMKTAGRVIALALEHGLWTTHGHRIAVDDTGVGGGVVDRLRELKWGVQAVNFGSSPTSSSNEVRFLNRRTELWWNLREWIRKDAALGSLSADVQDALRADLCAPKYEQRSDGRIALEPKDRVRSRVGRSPDHGDALALALAPVTAVPAWPWIVPRRRDDDEDVDPPDRRRSPSVQRALQQMFGVSYGPRIPRRPFE